MLPTIAFPIHDPDLRMFPHLQAILPDLKVLFRLAYVCPPLDTRQNAALMDWLTDDDFFTVFPMDRPTQVGEHFNHLYRNAARMADPDEIIHLAYLDRLSFILQGSHREQFLKDVSSLRSEQTPLIFQRSAAAWRTHPSNYYEIESFVTTIGKILFGRSLDYAWCHLVIQASRLNEIMPRVRNRDLSMVTEMILSLQSDVKTRDVDWLAWEDPFVLSRDPEDLRQERENDPAETQKRLAYTMPMVETLLHYALKRKELMQKDYHRKIYCFISVGTHWAWVSSPSLLMTAGLPANRTLHDYEPEYGNVLSFYRDWRLSMTKIHVFHAVIENAGDGGAYVRIPFDVEEAFGKKRVPVKAAIDGQPYRGLLVRMGGTYHILLILKEIRRKIGKDFGDEVEVALEEDLEPRLVAVPPDLRQALDQDPAARAAFEKMSYTHRKEYVNAILKAKREQTRRSRIAKTIAMLKNKL